MTHLAAVTSPDWADRDDSEPIMLLLHGFGSHEHDLAGLASLLPAMPWASLRGPVDLGYGTAAWFPLPTLDVLTDLDPTPVEAATDAIWDWIDAHVAATAPLVTIGFSQGGLMATQLLRTCPERIGATVVLAGLTLTAAQPADATLALSRPPVFWGRGTEDAVIPAQAVVTTQDWMDAHSTLTAAVYPGLAHLVHEQEMADVRRFLAAALSDADGAADG